jgi:hypothetical protein
MVDSRPETLHPPLGLVCHESMPTAPTQVDAEQQLASLCGGLNTSYARLVTLAGQALTDESWAGGGIRSPEHWLTLPAGLSPSHARTSRTRRPRRPRTATRRLETPGPATRPAGTVTPCPTTGPPHPRSCPCPTTNTAGSPCGSAPPPTLMVLPLLSIERSVQFLSRAPGPRQFALQRVEPPDAIRSAPRHASLSCLRFGSTGFEDACDGDAGPIGQVQV